MFGGGIPERTFRRAEAYIRQIKIRPHPQPLSKGEGSGAHFIVSAITKTLFRISHPSPFGEGPGVRSDGLSLTAMRLKPMDVNPK
jgi:hypothetical protein